jgi:hypothetical protein
MRTQWCVALAAWAFGPSTVGQTKFDPALAQEGETYQVTGRIVDSEVTGDKVTVVLAERRKDGWTLLYVVPVKNVAPADFEPGRQAGFQAVYFGSQDSKSDRTTTSYFKDGAPLRRAEADAAPDNKFKAGQRASVTGIVAHDGEVRGVRAVILMKEENGVLTSYAFIVRDKKFGNPKPMSEVTLSGQFLTSKKDEKHGVWVHVFDGAKLEREPEPARVSGRGTGAPGGVEPGPAKAESSFDAALNGWRFQGTVEAEDQATAVFTKDGRTRRVRPGGTLDNGVEVLSVGAGWVKIRAQGSILRLSPW